MNIYLLLKSVHILCALITVLLFITRIGLDIADRSWRSTPLRWLPHVNDTVLLSAAIGLCLVTGWAPLVHHWLTAKVLLLIGYIVAGKLALDTRASAARRIIAASVALLLVGSIFFVALNKSLVLPVAS